MLNNVYNSYYFINFFKHMTNFFLKIFKFNEQRFLIFIIVDIFIKCKFKLMLSFFAKIINNKHDFLFF